MNLYLFLDVVSGAQTISLSSTYLREKFKNSTALEAGITLLLVSRQAYLWAGVLRCLVAFLRFCF